jgi:general secretion pathway protein D
LFRGKSGSRNQRVLLVMLRPRVVNSDSEAEALTRQQARAAKAASLALQPDDSARFPQTPLGALPFDGVNLNQPFDAGFVDPAAEKYNYPPLPSRLKFGE